MSHVSLSHTLTNGTPADASEVQENFIDITDQVNGNLDYTNLSETAGIKGTQLSTTYKIPTDRLAPDCVTKDILKDDTDPGSPLAAVNSSAHIKDGIVTKAKISGKLSLAQLNINKQEIPFSLDIPGSGGASWKLLSATPTIEVSGTKYIISIAIVEYVDGATSLSGLGRTSMTVSPSPDILVADDIVLGVYLLSNLAYTGATRVLTGTAVIIHASLS